MNDQLSRRDFNKQLLGTACSAGLLGTAFGAGTETSQQPFQLNYIVASCMYGTLPLETILQETPKTGAEYIEIWAKRHGNQREQIDELGVEKTKQLLDKYNVKLGSFTCFKYGLFNMQGEMDLVSQLGGDMVICNSGGPKGLKGAELKSAIKAFAEKLKPHIAAAEEKGVMIGLENHGGGLINDPDTQRWLMEMLPAKNFGMALAPYHLEQDPEMMAKLITDLDDRLLHFQAWQHGMGCIKKLPKEQELLQLPGRGDLNFVPLMAALKKINYQGRTEIFMHPVPRGIPILPTAEQVTAEINRSREYLEQCLKQA
ncbi:sugar phosphate isomerase/epimerase [Gimesia sp.]|uniref:sugar phosphate isomerase/epimerase family protein n=1 Tax=Gimesia sp. TaxID=2024833 RepID=UPI000C3A738D|nr:sugar phosphate isomerase/epimerase [Gimesia sp.]MAX37346.1 xylose isomerase [Gimesia sp.]HBL43801.1 xylose isomerase [Planctomycetaceae bacterium]|tara:strand:- start:20167 stop:21108 length:942 start_codon:yes stop_codon:yes gene_type:complete